MYNIVIASLLFLVGSSYARILPDNSADNNIKDRAGNVLYTGRLWPGGKIPYTLDEEIVDNDNCAGSSCTDFKNKIIDWTSWFNRNSSECFEFREKEDEDYYYLKFVYNSMVCNCTIGISNTREAQCQMHVNCSWGHALLHVLGMDHEWQRIDRDAYVEILWDNIQSGKELLRKLEGGIFATLCVPYKFDSIMHRKPTGVIAKDDPRRFNRKLPFMILRHPSMTEKINIFSDNEYPTQLDMETVKLAYGCIGCVKPTECVDEFKFVQKAHRTDNLVNGTFGGYDSFKKCSNPDIPNFIEYDKTTYNGGSWCSKNVTEDLVHIENASDPWATRLDCGCKKDLCSDPMRPL